MMCYYINIQFQGQRVNPVNTQFHTLRNQTHAIPFLQTQTYFKRIWVELYAIFHPFPWSYKVYKKIRF